MLLLPQSRQMLCCCCQAGIPHGMSHLQTSKRPAWQPGPACVCLPCAYGHVPQAAHVPCRLWTTDSVNMLRMAGRLRAAGDLPPSCGLWAVENPLLNLASRLESKVL